MSLLGGTAITGQAGTPGMATAMDMVIRGATDMAIPGVTGTPGTIVTRTMIDIATPIQVIAIPLTGLPTITCIGPLMSADPSLDRTGSHTEQDRFLMSRDQDKIHVTFQTGISNDQDKTPIQGRKTWSIMQGHPRREWDRIGRERGRFQIDQRAGTTADSQKTTSLPAGMETSIVGLRRVGSSELREVGLDLKERDKNPEILSRIVQVWTETMAPG